MPHKTKRAEVLETIENQIVGTLISDALNIVHTIVESSDSTHSSSSNESDSKLPQTFILYGFLQSQRYFKSRHHNRPNSSLMANDILNMPSHIFRIKFRMSPTSFHRIWQMIANHSIFPNNSNNPQFDPRLQFLIVLYHFGAYGNGASRSLIGNAFHISPGIIGKFTKRIIVALIETLEDRVIEWPSPARKEVIKQAIASEHGFQDAIGMIDGTHIILAYKPTRQGEGYFNRKSRYYLQCIIVSDHNCRILHMSVGFTGASHDT